jgi:glutathione reductase (NADPH)
MATHEGRIVGRNIVEGPSHSPDYAVIPSVVHTVPALATLGLTEEAAIAKGLNVKVSTSDMTGWFSAKSYAESVAWAKVLVDQDTDRIVGAHMVGHRADELIHLFAMAIRHDIPASAIKEDMFAFPTFSSDVKNLF